MYFFYFFSFILVFVLVCLLFSFSIPVYYCFLDFLFFKLCIEGEGERGRRKGLKVVEVVEEEGKGLEEARGGE